mmetsp:Transcript_22994/g.53721  ORF Transcript_22994/g.53721 Transcript_22994/m.53721 type:complete len:277 (-) Transcript_22994:1225-2055(-)
MFVFLASLICTAWHIALSLVAAVLSRAPPGPSATRCCSSSSSLAASSAAIRILSSSSAAAMAAAAASALACASASSLAFSAARAAAASIMGCDGTTAFLDRISHWIATLPKYLKVVWAPTSFWKLACTVCVVSLIMNLGGGGFKPADIISACCAVRAIMSCSLLRRSSASAWATSFAVFSMSMRSPSEVRVSLSRCCRSLSSSCRASTASCPTPCSGRPNSSSFMPSMRLKLSSKLNVSFFTSHRALSCVSMADMSLMVSSLEAMRPRRTSSQWAC